ncbi:MAG: DUF1761 domain-containing protein [Saprospiraceae bacterium]|nr:DUF1761 domain-containing protein [Saprospiraceae bacterium]
MQTKINWIALLTAVITGMAIGFLWYGFLFTSQWMSGNGMTMEGDRILKDGVEMPKSMLPMIVNIITLMVYAYFINWLITKSASFGYASGATLGAVLGIISFFGIYTANRFNFKPTSLSMVDGSYMLVLFTVMAAIIGGWRAK